MNAASCETFDYLVSACWADECKRRLPGGRRGGTEGQTMTSLTGATFKVYSHPRKLPLGEVTETKIVAVTPGNYARWWEFWRR